MKKIPKGKIMVFCIVNEEEMRIAENLENCEFSVNRFWKINRWPNPKAVRLATAAEILQAVQDAVAGQQQAGRGWYSPQWKGKQILQMIGTAGGSGGVTANELLELSSRATQLA